MYILLILLLGRTIAEAVSGWRSIVAARIRSQVTSLWDYHPGLVQ
jgi:hypothetical protein